jgi:hypothetical protein
MAETDVRRKSESRLPRLSFVIDAVGNIPMLDIHAGIEQSVRRRLLLLKKLGYLSGEVIELFYGKVAAGDQLNAPELMSAKAGEASRSISNENLRFVITSETNRDALKGLSRTPSKAFIVHVRLAQRNHGWRASGQEEILTCVDVQPGSVRSVLASIVFDVALTNCEPFASLTRFAMDKLGGHRPYFAAKVAFARTRGDRSLCGPIAADAGYVSFAAMQERAGAADIDWLKTDLRTTITWMEFIASVGVDVDTVIAAITGIRRIGGRTSARFVRDTLTAPGPETRLLVRGASKADLDVWMKLRGELTRIGADGLGNERATHKNWGRWKTIIPAENVLGSAAFLQAQLDGTLECTLVPRCLKP